MTVAFDSVEANFFVDFTKEDLSVPKLPVTKKHHEDGCKLEAEKGVSV